MTPYQRGNRDGLLNAAANLDQQAAGYDAEVKRIGDSPGFRPEVPSHNLLLTMNAERASVLTQTADYLRRLAEALPDDPEPTP